jgi:hypothetical protein
VTTPSPVRDPAEGAPFLAVVCACGKRAAVPPDRAGRSFRCPACGERCVVPKRREAGIPAPGLGGARCPICLSEEEAAGGAVRCPACRIAYHAECWAENEGCGAFGCPLAPEVPKEEVEGPVQTAWGDRKACPACGKEIQAVAIKCRHCKADLGTRDSISRREWDLMERRKQASAKGRTASVAAFLLSATCVGMPFGVGMALYHLLPKARREVLEAADRFLYAGALGVAALYLLLAMVIQAGGW